MVSIRILEKQSGILRLIVFLHDKKDYMLSDIWEHAEISVHQGYESLAKCKELGLVRSRLDDSKYPPRNLISLTPRGKKVAQKLKEIEDLLNEGESGH
jgi:DNA-binding PadR family transcriptional regulator